MKRVKGFTLAEVLITLGIIGVVAALVSPALVQNTSEQTLTARLKVTLSDVQGALGTMLVQEGVESLFDTDAWGSYNSCAAFAGYLGQYLHINGFQTTCGSSAFSAYYSDYSAPYGIDANGAKNTSDTISITGKANDSQRGYVHVITAKNGAVLFIVPNVDQAPTQAAKNALIAKGCSLFNEAADVFIDVNGGEKPNVVGRDLFTFYLGDNGVLYPFGGMQVGLFDGSASYIWSNTGSYSCLTGSISNHGWGCTGRLIDEGYKVNY